MNFLTMSTRFSAQGLQEFCKQIFCQAGVRRSDAQVIADSLVQANLRGVDSHGVIRTPIYLKRLEAKMISPHADIEIVADQGAVSLIHGHNYFGSVIGTKATHLSLEKARKHGVAVVGVKGSNHFGTGAYYVLQAIEKNMILMVLSNASQTMPPTGGIRPFIGTNPLAIGVPAGAELPFVLDMATSVVARGKIIIAAQKGESIPLGWAIDKQGNPTTNAEEALAGSVLPVGGPKGYGISMFIDILSGVLTGAGFGPNVNNMYENWEEPQNVGHFFLAIDIDRFIPINLFKDRMDQYIRGIKEEPRAPGVKEIFIPGELEYQLVLERQRNGIELPEKVVEELDEIGHQYHLNLSRYT